MALPFGLIVLDTNVLKHLTDPATRQRVADNWRKQGMEMMASAVNILEIVANENETARIQLFGVVDALAVGKGVLPFPPDMLEEIGRGKAAGARGIAINFHGFSSAATIQKYAPGDSAAIAAAQKEPAVRWRAGLQADRARIQAQLRGKKLGPNADTLTKYLDYVWSKDPVLMAGLMKQQWELYGLPATFDAFRMRNDEAWRLYFEGLGAVHYVQVFAKGQARLSHPDDIAQLIYLALSKHRILVTDDQPFFDLATEMLAGRYPNVRVIKSAELLQ